jgi:hypothetical protein
VRASLVAWATGPGGTAHGPGKGSASGQLSLWCEQLLKYLTVRAGAGGKRRAAWVAGH